MAEKTQLEEELKSVGRRNPDNPADWEAVPNEGDTDATDMNDRADSIEDYEENTAILRELEIRYNQVLKALEKIETGTYGTCEVGGEEIPEARLEANPSATTCVAHANGGLEN